MNILIDELPTTVEIDGSEYAINKNFRDCLRVIMAYEDVELTGLEKQAVLLECMYPEIPENTVLAIEMAVRFLDGGKKIDQSESEKTPDKRVFSFLKDANYIFSAFRQTHGIDLEAIEYMHWWKFLALYMDLGDTFFCNLTSLRKRVLYGKATEEEIKAANELGDVFDLGLNVDVRTPEQVEMDDIFDRAVEGR